MARVVALLLLVLALAGCTAEPPTLEGQLPNLVGDGGTPGLPLGPAGGSPSSLIDLENATDAIVFQAPIWLVGDSWRFNIASGDRGGGGQQLVVVGETTNEYLLATTDRQDAVVSAFFSRSLPGPVGKQTLSGFDRGTPTRYLDFPVQANQTWTLHVRGADYLVKANFTRSTDGGRGPGLNVEGASALGDKISLQYAPSVKWMTRFQLTSANGANQFSRTLVGHSNNYTGPYFSARVEDLFTGARNGTQVAPPADTFTQSRPYAQLHLVLSAFGSGAADVRIVDQNGALRYNFTANAGGLTNVFQEADLPSVPGAWRILWNVAGPLDVFLRIAGADVTEGKL